MTNAWKEAQRGPYGIGFVARAALVVIALWALAHLFWLARELLFVAFFAVLVAAFLSIFVERLRRLGVPRAVGAPLVLVLALAILTGVVVLLWPTITDQFQLIREQFPSAVSQAVGWARRQYVALMGQMGLQPGRLEAQVRQRFGQEMLSAVSGALPLLNTAFGAVFGILIVLFAGLYMAVDPKVYARGAAALVPPRGRERTTAALHRVGSTLRRWMLGTLVSMTIIGVATTLGLWILGIPAALVLGLIAGVLQFIPIFGPILSAVPALAVALVTAPGRVLWVVVLYAGIQTVESNLITPLVMRKAVRIPPALTILFQSLMALIFGFLGLLLAVPILAMSLTLIQMLYVKEAPETGSRATS